MFHSLRHKFCLRKIFVFIPLGFLFKQVSTIIFSSVFIANSRVLKSLFPERKPSQVCDILIFQSWHTRNTLYLTLAYLRSTLVRCSECFQAKLQKRFFTNFFLIFGPTSLSFLSKIFCWLLGPRRLFFALRNLGRMASLFLENFILQVTNPLFLENGWFCGENYGLHFWVFVAENKSSISSGQWKISAHMFHFLRLKLLYLEKLFCDYFTWFSI